MRLSEKSSLIDTIFIMSTHMLSSSIILPIISLYIRSQGFSLTELGIITSGSALGTLSFEALWGVLSDRGLKKRILLFTSVLSPVILCLYIATRGFWLLFALRYFQGATACGGIVAVRGLLSVYSTKRGGTFGVLEAATGVASLVGPTLGGYLATIDYSLAFYASAVSSAVAVFGILLLVEPKVATKEEEKKRGKFMGGQAGVMALVATTFLVIFPRFVWSVLNSILPVYFNESPKFMLGKVEIGVMFSILNAITIPTLMLFGWLSDRIGRTSLIILAMALWSVSFGLLPSISGLYQAYLMMALFAVARSSERPVIIALLTDNVPSSMLGTAIGIYGSGEDIGILLGSSVTAYTMEHYGSAFSFYFASALLAVGFACAIVLLRRVEEAVARKT